MEEKIITQIDSLVLYFNIRFDIDWAWFSLSVSEIKLLFCALTGCTSHKTVHPEIAPCTLPIYSNDKWLKKRAHTGCTTPKIVHPAVEMCTPGAGCTLNFGHCLYDIDSPSNEFP